MHGDGKQSRGVERVNERVWSRLTLLGRSDAVQSPLAVGWQDELVNDCPHRQKERLISFFQHLMPVPLPQSSSKKL